MRWSTQIEGAKESSRIGCTCLSIRVIGLLSYLRGDAKSIEVSRHPRTKDRLE